MLAVWTTAETSISVMVVAAMALAPLLRKIGPTITDNLRRLKVVPKWRLRLFREEQLLPTRHKSEQIFGKHLDGDDSDELPMPKPTAMWHMWPVDLDVNSMSVTTVTETSTSRTQKMMSSSSRKSVSTGKSTWGRSMWEKSCSGTQMREESFQPQMVSRGTQTLGRVVVELDPDGLPYGASLVDWSPA